VYRGLCEEPITCPEESTDCGVFRVIAEPQRGSLGPVVLSSYAKKENAFAGIFKK